MAVVVHWSSGGGGGGGRQLSFTVTRRSRIAAIWALLTQTEHTEHSTVCASCLAAIFAARQSRRVLSFLPESARR